MNRIKTIFCMWAAFMMVVCMVACKQSPAGASRARDARTIYLQAVEAVEGDSVVQARHLLHAALDAARREPDYHTLYLAQWQLAQAAMQSDPVAALDMAREALATYEAHPDDERNHIILLDAVGTCAAQLAFDEQGSYDEALTFTHRAHDLALDARDTLGTELVSQTHTSLANILWAMERYPEALVQARLAEACAPPTLLLGAQQVLARCLESCDSLPQAEALYRSMQPGDDTQMAYIIESNLARLALHRRDTEQAEEALDEAFDHAEDLYFRAMREKDQYYQSLLQRERDNERLRYTSALHRRTLWGIIGLALILMVTATYIIYTRTRMAAQRRIADAWRRKHEVDERIHEARLHRQTSMHHQQQLAAQQETLRQRDATIAFLQDFILQRCEVIRKLDSSSEKHIVLSPHEWQEVERTLDVIDGGRYAHLRECYPGLREDDMKLCILTRLRLSNRAIGNIYSISVSAVQHRKLKLKKEVFGQDDPDLSLEQVLSEMVPAPRTE